jgi:ABC-2 type transport system permease protein
LKAALTIALKDLRLRLRDRSAFIVGIVAPLSLAFILQLVVGGTDEFDAGFAVVDEDGGPVAQEFTEVVTGIGNGLDVETDLTEDEARQQIDDDELDAAFVLPEGFSEAARSAEPAQIQVIGNIDEPVATQIATAIAEGFAGNLNVVRLSVATAIAEGASADPADLGQAAVGQPDPIAIGQVQAAERQLDTTTYLIAGLSVFFLFFLVQYGVTGLLEEQDNGTMARLMAAPIPRFSVLGGKGLTSVVMGLVTMTTLVIASTLLMGADWGDPLPVAVLVVAAVVAVTSIMAVVAGVANTTEQAGSVQSIIAVGFALLGGSFFPVVQEGSGGFLTRLSAITPNYWFLRGLGDISGGGGVAEALPAVAALLVFAVVFGTVGLFLLYRKVDR